MLIGAVFFGLYAVVNPQSTSDKRIVVDDGRINNLIAIFEKTWNRQPSERELQGLINDFVLEEIYYREALQMGIDQNDAMIRRRLRQKMEFFANAATSIVQPDTEELQQYLLDNQEKYRIDNRYSFQQIFVSTDPPMPQVEQTLAIVQTALQTGAEVDGDKTLLPSHFANVNAFELNRTFGTGFAVQLDDLIINEWSEPLPSGLGLHFIKLKQIEPGHIPALTEVRDQVMRDWMYERTETLRAELENKLLQEYQVVVLRDGEIKTSAEENI